jgi:NADH-quinone oxidoreductase subunit M
MAVDCEAMNDFYNIMAFAIIALPLITSLGFMVVPNLASRTCWLISSIVSLVTFGISVLLFVSYDTMIGGTQFGFTVPWLSQGINITFGLGLTGISASMVLLNGIVLLGACLISTDIETRGRDFYVLLLALGGGVFGVFLSSDLFFFFLFYELAVLPMYLLIAVWGSSTNFGSFNRSKEYGAMKLMMVLVAASVLIWIGIIAIYVETYMNGTPTFVFDELRILSESGLFSSGFQNWVFLCFMIGFGVLSGLWPFHTWSPDGHVAAPTGVSMLHAGVLMKLGAFGIIQIGIVILPLGAQTWMPLLMVLGIVNVIYGAVSAMSQTDLKYIIGYSSVSHMGYVLIGAATLNSIGLSGAVLQMFSHGIMTALMFVLVGAIYHRAHTRDIYVLNGLIKTMPHICVLFIIAGFASLGLPGLSGFIAEFLIFLGVIKISLWIAALAVLGAALTAVYILRLIARTIVGPVDPKLENLPDANKYEKIVSVAFASILIAVGVWPALLLDSINVGISSIMSVL